MPIARNETPWITWNFKDNSMQCRRCGDKQGVAGQKLAFVALAMKAFVECHTICRERGAMK